MDITFEVSGGFGGLFAQKPLVYRVALAELPEPERMALKTLVEASGLRSLRLPAPPRQPRGQKYRLTLNEGGQTNTLECDDVGAPATLRPLLAHLQQRALAARAKG